MSKNKIIKIQRSWNKKAKQNKKQQETNMNPLTKNVKKKRIQKQKKNQQIPHPKKKTTFKKR